MDHKLEGGMFGMRKELVQMLGSSTEHRPRAQPSAACLIGSPELVTHWLEVVALQPEHLGTRPRWSFCDSGLMTSLLCASVSLL